MRGAASSRRTCGDFWPVFARTESKGPGARPGPSVKPVEVQAAGARLALTETLRKLDAKIHSHMMRVGLLAGLIAYRMGHTLEYSRRVAWGARVHDIGKREEPIRAVVSREGRLDEAERAVMERHPGAGAAIIALDLSLDPVSRRVGMRVALNLGRGGGRHVPGGP